MSGIYLRNMTNRVKNLGRYAKKGAIPWNKGIKMSKEFREKCSLRAKKLGQVPPLRIGGRGKNHPMYGKKHSMETRLKMSKNGKGKNMGNKNHNWKGGVANPIRKIRMTLAWKLWRENVFERDVFTCLLCNRNKLELHPHHIKSATHFPKEIFNIDNGTTICKECHYTVHSNSEMQNSGWYIKKEVE